MMIEMTLIVDNFIYNNSVKCSHVAGEEMHILTIGIFIDAVNARIKSISLEI